jgi:murein DD-endopeptidase MepM/ murein hydrolase activator NlpD
VKKLVAFGAALVLAGCDSVVSRVFPMAPDAEAPPPPPPQAIAPPAPVDPLAAAHVEKIAVQISGSLEETIRQKADAEIAAPLAQVTARLLLWWVDVARGLRPGDSLELIYERVPGKEPLIHAVKFYSTKNEKEYRAYLYKPEGGRFAHYYDASGEEVEERLEKGPIDDYEQVTSILRDGRRHKGVDFKAPVGTPVKAPFDLTLTRKNWNWRRNGNCLELKDAQGRRFTFLHLSEIPKSLTVGKRFKAGEQIAMSGNTGHTTAPHLHYQLEAASGKLLDPFNVHKIFHAKLGAGQLAAYQAEREKYNRMFEFKKEPAVATPAVLNVQPVPDAGIAPTP